MFLPRIQWEIASRSRHPTLLLNKLRCSPLRDEKIIHNQSGGGLEFVGTRAPIFGRFCSLFSHHEQIIRPCGNAGTEKDSHETDNRLIHIFNPFGCGHEIENVHLPNGIPE